ncbi:hypothetical protein ILUMI_07002 [Ignelater luminosus]|uniref:Uncharacterized protein n=1 Tax=Ignelater luminosus TaxID=2038154 RepID=A0A8K0GIG8_IGNLU|nr:hypothetical protein ILUMI_07002 [Ignelater luminosus]
MANYTFQRDERQMSYLYLQLVLNWTFDQVSNFRTYQSALQDVLLLTAIPFMSKLLGWRDTIISILGAIAHCIARVFYAVAETGWLIYVGGAFASLGPVVAPIIRSMVSKLVAPAERGKAFSILAVADNAVPIISATLYNQVYKHTIHTHPAGIFYLTIASQVVVLGIFFFIHFTSTEETLAYQDEESTKRCLENEGEASVS